MMSEGMLLAAVGAGIGIAASFAVTRLMSTMLFGITPTDTATFAGITVMLTLVALIACVIPAFRATRVDPVECLRL